MNRQLCILSVFFLLLFTFQARAAGASPEFFQQNFELVRDNQNRLIEVRIKKKLVPRLQLEIEKIVKIQRFYQMKGAEKFIDQLSFSDMEGLQEWPQVKMNFWNDLLQFPLEDQIRNEKFRNVLFDLEKIILNNYPGANIIARPNQSNFFFLYKLERGALELARNVIFSKLAGTAGAGVAFYFFENAIDQIEARRTYYQNILLQLMETDPSFALQGDEARLVASSIMESRLSWYDFSDHEQAQNDWLHFGTSLWSRSKAKALGRWNRHRMDYDQSQMINFGFSQSFKGGNEWIHDQMDKKSQFSSGASISYNQAKPLQVKEERQLYELVSFGIGVLPVVSIISPLVNYCVKKMYWQQVRSEGALYMSLIQQDRKDLAKLIVRQSLNSFLIHEL